MCALCDSIPSRLHVDTLHDPDAFPPAARGLAVVGGDVLDGQVRKCPGCDARFLYSRSHDNESGVGHGYTDELIVRITAAEARRKVSSLLLRRLRGGPRDAEASTLESELDVLDRVEGPGSRDAFLLAHGAVWQIEPGAAGGWDISNRTAAVTADTLSDLILDIRALGVPALDSVRSLTVEETGMRAVPDHVAFLSGLVSLDLGRDAIGHVSDCLGHLPRLRDVNLSNNPLGHFPPALLDCTGLSHLALIDTGLVHVPEALGRLVNLTSLILRDNRLTTLPASLGRLRRLTRLSVVGNPLRELPREILDLPLESVELDGTAICDLPEEFARSPIRFSGYANNAVPAAWRAAYGCDSGYRALLKWFIDRGAICRSFSSGAWNHEDRFDLVLAFPAAGLERADLPQTVEHAAEIFPILVGAPVRTTAYDGQTLMLEGDGRGGTDQIRVELVGRDHVPSVSCS